MGQRVRFYTDEHVPRAAIRGLRQRGVDVLTAAEAGLLKVPTKIISLGHELRIACYLLKTPGF